MSLPFGASALAAQSDAGALIDLAGHGWVQRLVQAAYGALFYPRAMLATAWSPLYERPTVLDPTEPRFVASCIAAVAVTLVLLLLRRRFPAGLAVWLGYLALLAPVSGIAQSGVQLVADRYAYLAGSGFALLLGGGAAIAWSATAARTGRRLLAAGLAALLALWGGLSWRQSRVWRDDATLWQYVLKFGPSAMASNNLGAIAVQQGAPGRALAHFRRAVEIAPRTGSRGRTSWRCSRATPRASTATSCGAPPGSSNARFRTTRPPPLPGRRSRSATWRRARTTRPSSGSSAPSRSTRRTGPRGAGSRRRSGRRNGSPTVHVRIPSWCASSPGVRATGPASGSVIRRRAS
ncbi:MAG: hypothetical protein R2862_07685 [Thermoanaerobaculia bacterium]